MVDMLKYSMLSHLMLSAMVLMRATKTSMYIVFVWYDLNKPMYECCETNLVKDFNP